MNIFFQEKAWLLPLIALALITPFTPSLDLSLSNFFYKENHNFSQNPFFFALYQYGTIPGLVVFFAALFTFFFSLFFKYAKKWQKPALILITTLTIGSGLIVHEIFKEHWGRPRPKQIIQFGGNQHFRAYYQPNFFNQPEPSKSFSCGHCTMGFYFFALAIAANRLKHKKLYLFSLLIAFSLGIALSTARIAQGGHFFSDTLVSALIMWLTAYFCDRWIYNKTLN